MPTEADRDRGNRGIRALPVAGLLLAFALLLAWALTLRREIAPAEPPLPQRFTALQVQRGARLAAVGDCIVCHTSDKGEPFAGGRPLATPFGTLYATNITPDAATGIGQWSAEAFRRAMREGVSRDGRHLYPALPYEHFSKVSDADLADLYAYLMTRQAVHAVQPPNALVPPLGFRPLLAGWKFLFVKEAPFSPDPSRTTEWNRGAYLVEGLGHCGGCHTPRNILGAEQWARPLAGGVAEGWDAPPLDAGNPAAVRWNAATLYQYLREGAHPAHGVAGGPMGPVAHGLGQAAPEDVRAIAVYIEHRMHAGAAQPRTSTAAGAAPDSQDARAEAAARAYPVGATIFSGACAGCHGAGAPMLLAGRAGLQHLTALQSGTADNALLAILQGLRAPTLDRGPLMPPFAETLGDAQIAAVAAYVRARFTDRPPWPDLERSVARARKETSLP